MNPDDPIPWIDPNRKLPGIEDDLWRLGRDLTWLVTASWDEKITDYRRRWATPWRFR